MLEFLIKYAQYQPKAHTLSGGLWMKRMYLKNSDGKR